MAFCLLLEAHQSQILSSSLSTNCQRLTVNVIILFVPENILKKNTLDAHFEPLKTSISAHKYFFTAYRLGIDVKKYVESEDIETNRPLQWAISVNNRAVIELLFTHGTSSNTRKRNLQTPLHLAAIIGNSDLVELLIEKEALVNCKDAEKLTPLHWYVHFITFICLFFIFFFSSPFDFFS